MTSLDVDLVIQKPRLIVTHKFKDPCQLDNNLINENNQICLYNQNLF